MDPSVSIILLNWNTDEETIECLESLFDIKYNNYHVIVVDNDSEEESLTNIKEYLNGNIKVKSNFVEYDEESKPVEWKSYNEAEIRNSAGSLTFPHDGSVSIIENDSNYGFPGGNNIGVKYALEGQSDYILYLNNDTVVDNEFLSNLVDTAESDESIGIVGSKIYYYDDPQRVQSFGGDMVWWMFKPIDYGMGETDSGQYSDTEKRDFAWATSQLVDSEVLKEVGLMDEKFFFGIEEYDLCDRAKKGGYDVVVEPTSHVWHKGHASANKLEEFTDTRKKINSESGLLNYKLIRHVLRKHYGPIKWIVPFLLRYIWVLSMFLYKKMRPGISKYEVNKKHQKDNI